VLYWKWWCHKFYNQIPNTYEKFVFVQFNKKKKNSHLIWRDTYKLYDVLSIDFVIFYFDAYISSSIDCSKFKHRYNLKIYVNPKK
jgi:hypothetical protein